jgi:SAM-dependent methyltransferase
MSISGQSERYSMGYEAGVVARFSARRAECEAAFILPFLHTGMALLDCGCGPGSITVGLAEVVSPGMVVGVDIEPSQIKLAQDLAIQCGSSNVAFQVASVYRLPFPDNVFDSVFANSLASYLADPLGAFREMFRVLKPGGMVGVRSVDFSGFIIEPSNELLDRYLGLLEKDRAYNGGDARIGKRLRGLLSRAGFIRCQGLASYECHGTPESTRVQAYDEIRRIESSPVFTRAVDLGWVDRPTLENMKVAWQEWGEGVEAFGAYSYGEAVGWKQ